MPGCWWDVGYMAKVMLMYNRDDARYIPEVTRLGHMRYVTSASSHYPPPSRDPASGLLSSYGVLYVLLKIEEI